MDIQKRLTRWREAQHWEKSWWGDCRNTYNEETKQFLYADRMGLTQVADNKTPFRFDMGGKLILDIGGGPVSLLLKCDNVKGKVIDPLQFPKWVEERYKVVGIEYDRIKAEEIKVKNKFDEVWCYNVLEHVEDPHRVLETMKKVGKLIRIFEWLETRVNIGHPHSLTEQKLNHWLGGKGKVEEIKGQNSCWGKAFYGIFKGANYEE